MNSIKCFNFATLGWWAALISLPLDLFLYGSTPVATEMVNPIPEWAPLVLLGIALLGLIHGELTKITLRLFSAQQSYGERAGLLFIGIVAVLAAAEIFLRLFHFGDFAVVAAIIAAAGALLAARRAVKQTRHHRQRLAENPMLRIEQMNTLFLIISLLPIAAARAYSAVSISFMALTPNEQLIASALSALLIVTLKPREEDFVMRCKRCHQLTSRALQDEPDCPRCASSKYLPKVRSV